MNKKLTKKQKIQIWGEIENEGLGYWCQNGGNAYVGTEIGSLISQAREALNKLEKMTSQWEGLVGDE